MQEPVSEPEALFVAHLDLLERVIQSACRHQDVSFETSDFSSYVKVRLIEDDYRILRQFEGRCSLATYYVIVVRRMLSDYRIHLWGKWHPSAEARRLGPLALRVEVLLRRDRRPPDEAFQILAQSGHRLSRAEFDALAARIPMRQQRALFVAPEDVEGALAVSSEQIELDASSDERSTIAEAATDALRTGLADLPAADLAILRLHFDGGASVAEIARLLGLEQKPLYRRIRTICDGLRHRLVAAGVDAGRANEIIGRPDTVLEVGLRAVGNSPACPSANAGREMGAEGQVSR
jgi:RNA polymerase sigma factor (sigma-70 family)